MMKKILVILIILIMLISFSGCGSNPEKDTSLGWGTYKNGVYENSFFNFSIDIPQEFIYLSPQEVANMNAGLDENGQPDPVNINDIEDLGSEALVHYVYATKYDADTNVDFNPYINIFSENMQYSNSLYNKEDYVENSMNYTAPLFRDSGIEVEVYPLEKPWLGERQFAKGTMRIKYAQFTMFQEMYAIIKNDFVLVILIGYSNDAEKEELHALIDSLQIN